MFKNRSTVDVLIVDDIEDNRKLLASIIAKNRDYNVKLASSGIDVVEMADKLNIDLILLDIMMPGMDGFEVAYALKSKERFKNIPILFITAVNDTESIVKGFKAGGVDYISKPFNKEELLQRMDTQINLKLARDELEHKNLLLEDRELHLAKKVEEKTKQVETATLALVTALESANFYNDTDTGDHIKRVCEYTFLISDLLGMSPDFCRRIKLLASLHDVGKVAIPDSILKKHGRYTADDFEQMKDHVRIGGIILSNAGIDPMAKNIALYHHEKWDGTGYIAGLKGKNIPLEARITALADVYDALSTKRIYKNAYDNEKVDKIIRESRGSHFDPELADLYRSNREKFIEIKEMV